MGGKAKTVLLAVCVLCLIIAIIMITVGAVALSAESTNAKLININYTVSFIILIVAGVLALIAFVIGLAGTVREERSNLNVFLVCLLIVVIFTLVAGILGFAKMKDVEDNSLGNLKNAINGYGMSGKSEITTLWKTVQDKLECCGVHYYTDWRKTAYAHNRYDKVPQSCCKKGTVGCTGLEFRIADVVDKGCHSVLKTAALKNLQGVGITGIIFAIIELLLLIAGVVWTKKLGKDDDKDDKHGGTRSEMESIPVPTSEPPKAAEL